MIDSQILRDRLVALIAASANQLNAIGPVAYSMEPDEQPGPHYVRHLHEQIHQRYLRYVTEYHRLEEGT